MSAVKSIFEKPKQQVLKTITPVTTVVDPPKTADTPAEPAGALKPRNARGRSRLVSGRTNTTTRSGINVPS